MRKITQTIFGAAVAALSLSAQAQVPAVDLTDSPIVQLEKGQAIDIHGEYTIIGSKFGYNTNGVGMLFHNDQHIRNYRLSPSNKSDYLGNPKTVGIGQHAIVLGGADYQISGQPVGTVGIVHKSWNGSHYDPYVTQQFYGTVGSRFGRAVAISDHWIAVGAPEYQTEGGVKMLMRNHSTGFWEDKGWLPLPNFNDAPGRNPFGGNYTVDASFGESVDLYHNNLIVGAPAIGAFYIYSYNGSSWQLVTSYNQADYVGNAVAITDQYAASISFDKAKIYKKNWDNTWQPYQTISGLQSAQDVELDDGGRMVIGKPNSGFEGRGEVQYYELRAHPQAGSYNWVYDFVHVGNMHVDPAASNNGMINYRLLGYAVDIQGNYVVAGAPNVHYENVADGAGFRALYYQMDPVSNNYKTASSSSEQLDDELYLYPNPAIDIVSLSSSEDILEAKAISLTGQEFLLSPLGSSIDVSQLPSGLYTITITTENGNVVNSITIE